MGAPILFLLRYLGISLLSGAAFWGIGTVVKGATYLAFLTGAVFFIGKIAAFFGKIIDELAAFPNFILDLQIITLIWTLVRDFVNLFFILILLVIAFATIFNKPQGYRASDLLPKLIIAALLVNFSLVITQTVIEFLYTPAPIFINGLGGPDFTGKIADALRIHKFFSFQNLSQATLFNSLQQYLGVGWLIYTIAGIAANIVLIWVGLILLIRLPMLIGLAVVSPITWLAYSFPRMQSFWDDWWCKLLYWSLIPVFLFGVIYFSLLINRSLETIQIPSVPLPFIGINLDQFIILFVTATSLIGGLWWVNNFLSRTACLAGYNLASATFGRVRGWFWGGAGWAAGRAAGGAQGLYRTTGVPAAAGALEGRIAEEGLPGGGITVPGTGMKIFGGQAARKTREARMEDRFAGWAGLEPRYKAQTEITERAGKEEKNIENRFRQVRSTAEETVIIDELRTKVSSGAKDPETLAAINALAKKGQLDVALFNRAVDNFRDMPLALTKVFSEWKEGKFGGVRADELIPILRDIRTPLEAKRIGYNFIASDDGKRVIEDRSFDYAEFKEMYEILGGRNTKDGRTAKKSAGEIKPTIVGEYNFKFPTTEFDDPADYPADIADAILKQIKKTGSKDFTKYGKDIWNNPEFKSALGDLLYNKATTDIGNARKYTEEVRKWLIRESKDEDELRVFNDAATMAGI